jgi:hypothetical protein
LARIRGSVIRRPLKSWTPTEGKVRDAKEKRGTGHSQERARFLRSGEGEGTDSDGMDLTEPEALICDGM